MCIAVLNSKIVSLVIFQVLRRKQNKVPEGNEISKFDISDINLRIRFKDREIVDVHLFVA